MANLIACATGNFTTAGTWEQVDSTSELDSEANSTAISTSNLDSSTFVPGAITVDAVAVKLAARATSPSGTFTVTLWDATASSSAAAVTVNVSDLPAAGLSWAVFKFGSSVTLTAGHNYDVRVTCSAGGSQVSLFRDGTANNWSRKLRTTTTQAPAANNHLVISNELTGAGTSNAITVTMNNTATTTWGPSTVGTQGVVVSCFGTLTFGTAASTNYYFRWRGVFLVCGGGTVNVGASGGRIPTTSSVTLEMDCAANSDSRLKIDVGGDVEIWGADKTPSTTMTADAAFAATVIHIVDTTGWQISDQLGFSPTNSDITETERDVILTVDSSTQVTLTAGLSKAKKGTGFVICNVVNLTRNVKFQSLSTSNRGNLFVPAAGGTFHAESVEFVQDTLGTQSIPNTLISLEMTTNSVTLRKCSINPSTPDTQTSTSIYIDGGAVNNFTVDQCVYYGGGLGFITLQDPTSGTTWSMTSNIAIRCSSNNDNVFHIHDMNPTSFSGNRCFGQKGSNTPAFRFAEPSVNWSQLDGTKFQNLEASMNGFTGIQIDQDGGDGHSGAFYLLNSKVYRNASSGISAAFLRKLILDNVDMLGNSPNQGSQGANLHFIRLVGTVYMYGCTMSGDSVFTSGGATSLIGISDDDNNDGHMLRIWMFNCTMGVAAGTRVGFSTADITLTYPAIHTIQVIANNCNFASSVNFQNLTDSHQQEIGDHIDEGGSYLRAQRWGQTTGDHRTFIPQGTLRTDTAIWHSLSPSERMTPNTASFKLRSSPKRATIGIARQRTVSVWVRRSQVADAGGANYGGNQPRLLIRRNDSIGLTVDTVLATGSSGVGTWEQLSATTPPSTASDDGAMEFYVDCDGTVGWINVDDWGIV